VDSFLWSRTKGVFRVDELILKHTKIYKKEDSVLTRFCLRLFNPFTNSKSVSPAGPNCALRPAG
jgi:hypothetical protein